MPDIKIILSAKGDPHGRQAGRVSSSAPIDRRLISTATTEQVEKSCRTRRYGKDSVEMAYALWTRDGWRAGRRRAGSGASSLIKRIGLAEAHGLGG
jgi:hypothetical protein